MDKDEMTLEEMVAEDTKAFVELADLWAEAYLDGPA